METVVSTSFQRGIHVVCLHGYKYIRSEKDISINWYVSDFRELPLNLVYAFDDPDDQVTILNKLILDCIEKNAPIKRIRLAQPVAP